MPQQGSTIGETEKVSVGPASPSSDQVVTWKDFQVIKDNVASFKVLLESGVNNLAARQVMRNQAVPPTIAAPASQLPVAREAATDRQDAQLSQVYQSLGTLIPKLDYWVGGASTHSCGISALIGLLLPLPRPYHSSPVMCSSLGRMPQFRGLCPGMPYGN